MPPLLVTHNIVQLLSTLYIVRFATKARKRNINKQVGVLGTAGTELTVDKDFEVIFVNLATAAVRGLAVIAAGLALTDTTQSRARHQRVRTPEHRTKQSPESAYI